MNLGYYDVSRFPSARLYPCAGYRRAIVQINTIGLFKYYNPDNVSRVLPD